MMILALAVFGAALGRRAKVTGKLPYQEFYRESLRPLAAHLRRLGVGNQEDLEDIIQETYVQAYKGWQTLEDPQAAMAWLLTIGRRQLGKHRLRRKHQPQDQADFTTDSAGLTETQAHQSELSTGSVDQPAHELHAKSLCDQVRVLAAGIKDTNRRQAIELFYFHEHSLAEIAASTGVNTSTLTTWLSRFRQEVKDMIKASTSSARSGAGRSKP